MTATPDVCRHGILRCNCDVCTLEQRIQQLESRLITDTTRLDFLLANAVGIYLSAPYYCTLLSNTREAIDKVMPERVWK
jgi:hypothetical protein